MFYKGRYIGNSVVKPLLKLCGNCLGNGRIPLFATNNINMTASRYRRIFLAQSQPHLLWVLLGAGVVSSLAPVDITQRESNCNVPFKYVCPVQDNRLWNA